MKEKKETDLGKDKLGMLLLKLALPAILAQIINVLYNMVDRMYIGHIPKAGPDALTGVGVTMPVIMAISAFAALVSMGGAPRASIMMGRKDHKQAEKILGNCTMMLIIMAVILTGVFLIWGENILLIFGASEKTIGYALDYMKIYAMGTIFVQLALGLNAFINAQGFAKMGMLTVAIGAIINIILDPILIFQFSLGVKGAALATIISQAISSLWVIYFLTSKKSTLRIKINNLKLDYKIILPCLALGLSPFIMQFTESVISVCFNTSLLKYGGDIAVGSMTILTSVSFNYGANNIHRVKNTFKLLLKCSLSYSMLLWAIAVFIPDVFVYIFTNDSNLAEHTRWALRVYMAASGIFGIQIACQQTFIAIGNAKTSVFLAILRKIILLIPLIFILPVFISNHTFAVFLAEPIADTIAVSVTATLFYRTYKRLEVSDRHFE